MKDLARIAAVVLVAAAASGCFLDEIDKSVNANKGKAAATAPGTPAATASKQVAAAKPQPGAPKAPSWWETAKTLGSEESTSDIVGCQLGGRVEYMLRDDCLARGGATP